MSETPIESTGRGEQPRDRNGKPIHGLKGRSGPSKGNRNAMRHGLKAGMLPKGAKYIEHRINGMRRQLEDAVMAVRGEVGILDAANINSAIKWERHGLLAQLWLRKEVDQLSPTERLKFSETIAKASDNRDKAMRMLDLDRNVVNDAWASVDAKGDTDAKD